MNHSSACVRTARAAALLIALFMPRGAAGATLYWNGTGTSWNATASWSTTNSTTGPNPTAVPGSGDEARFSASGAAATQAITLDANQAANSVVLVTGGTVTLSGGGTNRALSLGGGGITVGSATGAKLTVGNGTTGQNVGVSLSSDQTWTVNSSTGNALELVNAVSGTSRLTVAGTGQVIMQRTNAYSGGTRINGAQFRLNNTGAAGTGDIDWDAGSLTLFQPNALQKGSTAGQYVNVNVNANNVTLSLRNVNDMTFNSNPWTFGSGISQFTLSVARTTGTDSDKTLTLGSGLGTAGPFTLNVTGANGYTAAINGAVALGGDFTVNPTTAPLAVNGVISGPGHSLTKVGSGRLTLGGANTYTGETIVSGGTLALGSTGSLASPVISVAFGSVFDVSAVSGFSLASGQRLGGAGSIVGNLLFGSGSELAFSPTDTLIVSSGTVSFASGFGIDDLFGLDGTLVDEGTYRLITGAVDFTGLDNVGFANRFAIGGGKQAYFTEGSLEVVVVPEPQAWAVLAAGVAAGLLGHGFRVRGRRVA